MPSELTQPSCRRCRQRKVKCSGRAPCLNCSNRRQPCIFDEANRTVVISERLVVIEGLSYIRLELTTIQDICVTLSVARRHHTASLPTQSIKCRLWSRRETMKSSAIRPFRQRYSPTSPSRTKAPESITVKKFLTQNLMLDSLR